VAPEYIAYSLPSYIHVHTTQQHQHPAPAPAAAKLYSWLSMFLTTPLIREFDAPSTARHTPTCPENLGPKKCEIKRKKKKVNVPLSFFIGFFVEKKKVLLCRAGSYIYIPYTRLVGVKATHFIQTHNNRVVCLACLHVKNEFGSRQRAVASSFFCFVLFCLLFF
jgi:hypothetical protein